MKKSLSEKELEQILKQSAEDVNPSPSVYKKIMEEIRLDVTNNSSSRYTLHKEPKVGRTSLFKQLSINFIITMQKLKYIIPAVAAFIVIVAIGYNRFNQTSPATTQIPISPEAVSSNTAGTSVTNSTDSDQTSAVNNRSSYPAATGNADDIANELNSDAAQQSAIQGEGDTSDQQAVSNTTQYIDNVNGASNVQ